MIRWMPLVLALLAVPAAAQPSAAQVAEVRDPLPAVLSPTIREVVQNAVDDVIRPGFADFHGKADILVGAFATLCGGPSETSLAAARDGFRDVALAHARIEHYRFGPLTADNRAERLLFFPDPKGIALRQIQAVLGTGDESATDPVTLREKSVALQGLTALEYVLYGTGADELTGAGGNFRCRYGAAIAQAVDTVAAELDIAWQAEDGIANHLTFPGPDNVDFRTETESLEGLAGVVAHGIEAIRDERLVPLLGGPELEKPAPRLALYWRSGLTIPAIGAGFEGLGALVVGSHMAERTPAESRWIGPSTAFQFEKVVDAAAALEEPVIEAVKDPAELKNLRDLLIATDTLRTLAAQGLPQALGLGIGFSALDKDTQ